MLEAIFGAVVQGFFLVALVLAVLKHLSATGSPAWLWELLGIETPKATVTWWSGMVCVSSQSISLQRLEKLARSVPLHPDVTVDVSTGLIRVMAKNWKYPEYESVASYRALIEQALSKDGITQIKRGRT